MNTRIYKNEFDPAYIAYLKGVYTVESETEKVLTLTDVTEEDDDKIHAAMFKSYAELCTLFPDNFTHFEDEVARFAEELHDLYYRTILPRMIKLQSTHAWDHTFDDDAAKAAYEKYSAISHLCSTFGYLTK